jgi:hypothetical protein
MKFKMICLATLLMAVPAVAYAGDKTMSHHMDMNHLAQMGASDLPTEGGQSAFAAIQEIVAMLEADPKTDWSKVDIEALRHHLIDMNEVTLSTVVTASESSDSITFSVSGEGAVVGSIQRMIAGHVATMDGVDGWKLLADMNENGAIMKVTPPDKTSMAKLHALSFIGVMTRGMHHQQHHWMLASGLKPHE